MPGIEFDHPVVGYAAYCTMKAVGYTVAARVISWKFKRVDLSSFLVGGVRTLIGMAAGAILWLIVFYLPDVAGTAVFQGMIAILLPIRIFEWWLLVWLFYDRRFEQLRRDWGVVACGVVWSFVLDVPAFFGFIATGGLSVC